MKEKLTLRELLAGYIVMHLKADESGTIIEDSEKNKRIFNVASKIMGGRDKLDNTAKKIVRILVKEGIIEHEFSEEELSELNKVC